MAKVIKIDKEALRSRWDYNDIQKKIRIEEASSISQPPPGFPSYGIIIYMNEFMSSYCGKTNEGLYDLRGFNFDNVVPLKYKNKYWHFNFKNCSNVDFSFSRNDKSTDILGTMDHSGCANKKRRFNVAVKQHASCTGDIYAQNTHCSTTVKTLEKYTNHYSDIRCTSTVVSKDIDGTILVRDLAYTQCNWEPSDNENQGD